MLKFVSYALAAVVVIGSLPAQSQDTESILKTAKDKQLERWEGVDTYMVEQLAMGISTKMYFQRTEVQDESGDKQTLFLPVSGGFTMGECSGARQWTTDELAAYEESAEMSGDANETVNYMAEFTDAAQYVGTETVDGRDAFHLRADNINRVQKMEDRQFTLQSISMWVDDREYVPLRMKMDGLMSSAGDTKPMVIDRHTSDYRLVPNSNMYESHKQVMNIAGVLTAADQAQLADAQGQLAEFEQELANMPADRRAMMENMMGDRLQMMRNMASGGGFQTEIVVNAITVNTPLPEQYVVDCNTAPGE